MKGFVFIALLPLLTINIQAQLVLEKDFPLEEISYFYITDSEGIFANYSVYSSSNNILLFDDNHQLVKTISAPADSILSIINISKYLYNEDELFELIYIYQTFENGKGHYNTHIIDENANILESLEDQYIWIQSTASGTRLISQKGSKVYNLPGINYPVYKGEKGDKGTTGDKGDEGLRGPQGEKGDPGTLNSVADCDCLTGLADLPVLSTIILSEPFPNPSSLTSNIIYDLTSIENSTSLVFYDMSGTKKLSLLLDELKGSLEINKSLFGEGVFLFRIESESWTSEIKKLIFH